MYGVILAVAYWYKHRNVSGVRPILISAALIFLVYASHLHSFAVLTFIFLLLALLHWREPKLVLRALVPFVPSFLLLGTVIARDFADKTANDVSLVLVYSGLIRKVMFAVSWIVSYSRWEAVSSAFLAVVTLILLVRQGMGRRVNPTFAAITASLLILYIIVPDHVSRFYYTANRIPPFVVLFGLTLLPALSNHRDTILVWAIATALLIQVTLLWSAYHRINTDLHHYAQCLEKVPATEDVSIEIERERARFGRLEPAALFQGYRYIDTGETEIPNFEGFVGAFRGLKYKNPSVEKSDLQTDERLVEIFFSSKYYIAKGGFAIGVGRISSRTREVAQKFGFSELVRFSAVTVFRKVAPVFVENQVESEYHLISKSPDARYLLIYGKPRSSPDLLGFVLVCRQGAISLYHRPGVSLGVFFGAATGANSNVLINE